MGTVLRPHVSVVVVVYYLIPGMSSCICFSQGVLRHTGINLSCRYIGMSQHYRNTLDIRTVLYQMSCKAVAQKARCNVLLDSGILNIGLEDLPESLS